MRHISVELVFVGIEVGDGVVRHGFGRDGLMAVAMAVGLRKWGGLRRVVHPIVDFYFGFILELGACISFQIYLIIFLSS